MRGSSGDGAPDVPAAVPMIARIWRGWTRLADADAYARYVEETGIAAYRRTEGNLGAFLLQRRTGDRAEFVTLSLWASPEAISKFAGKDDPLAAVFYPEDERYLVERDLRVGHYDVRVAEIPEWENGAVG